MEKIQWDDGCRLPQQWPKHLRLKQLSELTSPALPGTATWSSTPESHPTRASQNVLPFNPETQQEGTSTSTSNRTRC